MVSNNRQAIKRLSNNKRIVILKQDKGRGVVILNRSKYIEKCLSIVNSNHFLKIDKYLTASIERKVQRTLRKIKDKYPSLLYSKIYPTGSSPGRFYGTAKLHKLKKLKLKKGKSRSISVLMITTLRTLGGDL